MEVVPAMRLFTELGGSVYTSNGSMTNRWKICRGQLKLHIQDVNENGCRVNRNNGIHVNKLDPEVLQIIQMCIKEQQDTVDIKRQRVDDLEQLYQEAQKAAHGASRAEREAREAAHEAREAEREILEIQAKLRSLPETVGKISDEVIRLVERYRELEAQEQDYDQMLQCHPRYKQKEWRDKLQSENRKGDKITRETIAALACIDNLDDDDMPSTDADDEFDYEEFVTEDFIEDGGLWHETTQISSFVYKELGSKTLLQSMTSETTLPVIDDPDISVKFAHCSTKKEQAVAAKKRKIFPKRIL